MAGISFSANDIGDLASFYRANEVTDADSGARVAWGKAAKLLEDLIRLATESAPAPVEPPYYARDGIVWKNTVSKRNGDGSTSISLGFPICRMHDAVGNKSAVIVAELMNIGSQHQPESAHA